MTSMMESIGGLSHLVEAASALSKLADLGSPLWRPSESTSTLPTDTTQKVNLVVSDDEDDRKGIARQISAPSKDIFPQRLMEILESSYSDVISWLPHGRSFVIIRPDVFSEKVLPRFFPSSDARASAKYPSFTRKLNRWGFRQATRGPDTGAFHHPLFRKDQPSLCLDMVCQKSKTRSSASKSQNERVTKKSPVEASSRELTQMASQTSTLTKETLATLPTSEPYHQSKTVSVDSADDNRLSPPQSPPSNLFATHNFSYRPNMITTNTPFPAASWVPTDPAIVSKALRDREEREKLTIAKSMLYQAYLDAMRS